MRTVSNCISIHICMYINIKIAFNQLCNNHYESKVKINNCTEKRKIALSNLSVYYLPNCQVSVW